MRLVWGLDQQVADYVAYQFPLVAERGGFKVFRAVGAADTSGNLMAGLVLTEFKGHDADLSLFSASPRSITPTMLREFFQWAFADLGLMRLTANVSKKNKRCRRFVEGIGFKLEGTKRYAFDDHSDMCVYGMTFDQCPWAEIGNDNGKHSKST